MLQAGNLEDDCGDETTGAQSRLSEAVSDITKLAHALEVLAVTVRPEAEELDRDARVPAIGGYLPQRVDHQEAS